MPQCGLAPGAINICAASLMKDFDHVTEAMMRVGALPRFTTNEMSYYLSWSTNGLINEYCNEADAIYEGNTILIQGDRGRNDSLVVGQIWQI